MIVPARVVVEPGTWQLAGLDPGGGQQLHVPRSAPRDGQGSQGQFTGAYNGVWRETATAGEVDGRWRPDASKAAQRDLSTLRTVNARHETLTSKLFAMGATPLLTERRGFDGLAGPSGEWLAISGGAAYMPARLDKTLAELGLLGVGDAL